MKLLNNNDGKCYHSTGSEFNTDKEKKITKSKWITIGLFENLTTTKNVTLIFCYSFFFSSKSRCKMKSLKKNVAKEHHTCHCINVLIDLWIDLLEIYISINKMIICLVNEWHRRSFFSFPLHISFGFSYSFDRRKICVNFNCQHSNNDQPNYMCYDYGDLFRCHCIICFIGPGVGGMQCIH